MTDESQTEQFLKTNGPAPGYFAPDPSLEPLLEGKSELEKRFYRSQSTQGKQNDYIISQVQGLKIAARTTHGRLLDGELRFTKIESTLETFVQLRQDWLDKKGLRRKIFFGAMAFIATVIAGPLVVELVKHWLHWQ